ncbi:hypothetical protein H4Q26_005401 [Puccinia striiformis f. sp. tritici PST-130]|nr:hypothetical protein H4Q26_005401 [Puccinia striiformis f. sp. tritici PST-130]
MLKSPAGPLNTTGSPIGGGLSTDNNNFLPNFNRLIEAERFNAGIQVNQVINHLPDPEQKLILESKLKTLSLTPTQVQLERNYSNKNTCMRRDPGSSRGPGMRGSSTGTNNTPNLGMVLFTLIVAGVLIRKAIMESPGTEDRVSTAEAAAAALPLDPAVIEAERIENLTAYTYTATAHPNLKRRITSEIDEQQWGRSRQREEAGADNDTFWNRVAEQFLKSAPQSRRPPRSIQQRWAKLHQSITQFGECYDEEQARLSTQPHHTTPSMTEKIMVEALKQYKIRTDSNFSHYSCWTILKNRKEWLDHLNKPRLTSTSSSSKRKTQPEEDDQPLESTSSKSVKLSTDNNNPDSKRLKLIQDLIDSINEKNKLLKQFIDLENQANQIKIMEKFPDDHHSLVWFKIKQQEILNEFNLNILS